MLIAGASDFYGYKRKRGRLQGESCTGSMLLGVRGLRVLGPPKGVIVWVSDPPTCLSLFYQQGKEKLGKCSFSFIPGFFCRWGRVESSQMFLSPSPLAAFKVWVLVPWAFSSLGSRWEHGLLPAGEPASWGRARRVWRRGMLPPRARERRAGRLLGAMRREPRGSRARADSSRAPPPSWPRSFPSRSRLPGRVVLRPGGWRSETSF